MRIEQRINKTLIFISVVKDGERSISQKFKYRNAGLTIYAALAWNECG